MSGGITLLTLLENFVHGDRHGIPACAHTHSYSHQANWCSVATQFTIKWKQKGKKKNKPKTTIAMHRQINNWGDDYMPTRDDKRAEMRFP